MANLESFLLMRMMWSILEDAFVRWISYEKVIGLHTLLVRASGGREGRLILLSMLQLVVCAIR